MRSWRPPFHRSVREIPTPLPSCLSRATALANSGTGVRIYGGQDKATLALVDNGKEIRSEKIDGLSPATKTVRVILTIKGSNIRAKVLQGDDFEESISGRIKEATADGYFLFRAKSANQGPVLASLKITGEGIGRKPAGIKWPPTAEAPPPTNTPTKTTTSTPTKKEPAKALEPFPVPVRDFLPAGCPGAVAGVDLSRSRFHPGSAHRTGSG